MRKIWATSHELGWDSDQVHRFVDLRVGKKSLRELTKTEAIRVIDGMERFLGRGQATQETQGTKGENPEYRAKGFGVDERGKLIEYCTKAQLAKMRAVAGRLDWGDAWIEKVAGRALGRNISGLCNMRFREAMKVINVVEGLVMAREAKKEKKGRQESLQFAGCRLQEQGQETQETQETKATGR